MQKPSEVLQKDPGLRSRYTGLDGCSNTSAWKGAAHLRCLSSYFWDTSRRLSMHSVPIDNCRQHAKALVLKGVRLSCEQL